MKGEKLDSDGDLDVRWGGGRELNGDPDVWGL